MNRIIKKTQSLVVGAGDRHRDRRLSCPGRPSGDHSDPAAPAGH